MRGAEDLYRYLLQHFPPPEWVPVMSDQSGTTNNEREGKKDMATALVDDTVAAVNARIEELQAELAMAQNLRDSLTPEEPTEIGSVIRFVKYNFGYTFAAIKCPNGLWYLTQDGSRSSRQGHAPKSWDALLAWIGQRNWHRIEVLG